jgi:hypothetical protein
MTTAVVEFEPGKVVVPPFCLGSSISNWNFDVLSDPPPTYDECMRGTPNVAFPNASLYDPLVGSISIYYGGANSVPVLVFTKIDEMLEFLRANS